MTALKCKRPPHAVQAFTETQRESSPCSPSSGAPVLTAPCAMQGPRGDRAVWFSVHLLTKALYKKHWGCLAHVVASSELPALLSEKASRSAHTKKMKKKKKASSVAQCMQFAEAWQMHQS